MVLDASPSAWADWSAQQQGASVSAVLDRLLLLLNAHLGLQHNNQLAVFVSHRDGSHLVYPPASAASDRFLALPRTEQARRVRRGSAFGLSNPDPWPSSPGSTSHFVAFRPSWQASWLRS